MEIKIGDKVRVKKRDSFWTGHTATVIEVKPGGGRYSVIVAWDDDPTGVNPHGWWSPRSLELVKTPS